MVQAGIGGLVRGTLVATPSGDLAVEALRAGDAVLGSGGQVRRVLEVAMRRLDATRHPHPQSVRPVRLLRGAVANGVPRQPLVLSPGEDIVLGGIAIPACHLVNGATVLQDEPGPVEYRHVTLAGPDQMLLAEGLGVSSNPLAAQGDTFVGGKVVRLHPLLAPPPDPVTLRLSEAVRRRLLARARVLGHALTRDPAVHLLLDGVRVRPAAAADGLFRFALPPGSADIRIVSRAAVPAEIDPDSTDQRRLGVLIERLVLRGPDVMVDIALDDPSLEAGFHAPERHWGRMVRWTDGHARLRRLAGSAVTRLEIQIGAVQPAWAAAPVPAAPAGRSA